MSEQEEMDEYKTKLLYNHETEIALLRQAIGFLKNDIERIERSIERIENKSWFK